MFGLRGNYRNYLDAGRTRAYHGNSPPGKVNFFPWPSGGLVPLPDKSIKPCERRILTADRLPLAMTQYRAE